MSRLLLVAVAMLPAHLKARYREEWQADLAHAPAVSVRPAEVTMGALATAVRLAGMPSPALEASRSRAWIVRDAMAWVAGAAAAASFAWMLLFPGGPGVVAAVLLGLIVLGAVVVAGTRSARLGGGEAATTVVCGLLAVTTVAAIGAVLQIVSAVLVLAPVVIVVLLVVWMLLPAAPCERRPLARALAAGLTVLAATIVAVVDSLVLLPLTLVPHHSLPSIYEGLVAAGEHGGEGVVLVWSAVWALVAVVVACAVVRRGLSTRSTVAVVGGSIAVLVVSKAWSVFTLGMGIADAFLTGGGQSVLSPFFAVTGAIGALVASVCWLAPRELEPAA